MSVKANIDALEDMIDHSSLAVVVKDLVEIAFLKSAHVAENWQDRDAARSWKRDANKLAKLVLEN
jgi:hypothetical protein